VEHVLAEAQLVVPAQVQIRRADGQEGEVAALLPCAQGVAVRFSQVTEGRHGKVEAEAVVAPWQA
jgi:hypothetical protein